MQHVQRHLWRWVRLTKKASVKPAALYRCNRSFQFFPGVLTILWKQAEKLSESTSFSTYFHVHGVTQAVCECCRFVQIFRCCTKRSGTVHAQQHRDINKDYIFQYFHRQNSWVSKQVSLLTALSATFSLVVCMGLVCFNMIRVLCLQMCLPDFCNSRTPTWNYQASSGLTTRSQLECNDTCR